MKKTTLNNILIGFIVALCISICFLIVCIAKRPRYIETSEPQSAIIAEIPEENPNIINQSVTNNELLELPGINTSTTGEYTAAEQMGKTSTRVNIRDRATEDAKVLDTVEEGTTFEIVEVLDSGWTHILYEGADAYISSAYVIIINE